MEFLVKSERDISQIIASLLNSFGEKRVVLFYGEMGAGKTTLIKAICKYVGVDEPTTSHTFSIVNEYHSEDRKVMYHFDFYRIDNEEEVMDLGYEDYFYSGNYCFIEWPEKVPNLLPENCVKVSIKVNEDNYRLISVAS